MGRRVAAKETETEANETTATVAPKGAVEKLSDESTGFGEEEKNGPHEAEGSGGIEVSATWGEELFSPKQFHTFKVGPFSATTVTRPGETIEAATKRLYASLKAFAEKERDRKFDSYRAMLANKG